MKKNKNNEELCGIFEPQIELSDIYKKQIVIEAKLEVIFDTLEWIKIKIEDINNDKMLKEAKDKKAEAEMMLEEFKMQNYHKYDRMEEDKKRFYMMGEMK